MDCAIKKRESKHVGIWRKTNQDYVYRLFLIVGDSRFCFLRNNFKLHNLMSPLK